MPALKKTTYVGDVVFLGRVANRDAGLQSESLQQATLDWGGIDGEAHGGLRRPSCSRVLGQYPRGTDVSNTRQLSVMGQEDLDTIAGKIDLEHLDPRLLGASMVIKGIPDFTHVPPSSRLMFTSGAGLVVDMENRPCIYPAQEIEAAHAGHGKTFKAAAKGLRGVTAWVERPGAVQIGDTVTLFVPDQPTWSQDV